MWQLRWDRHGCNAGLRGARAGPIRGPAHQERAGQPAPIPGLGRRGFGDDVGHAGTEHSACRKFVEVLREQCQSMRRVAEQVALDQRLRCHLGDGVVQTALAQQPGGQGHKVVCGVSIGHAALWPARRVFDNAAVRQDGVQSGRRHDVGSKRAVP